MEIIEPKQPALILTGKLHYHESTRSRSIIRLKREVRKLFLEHYGKDVIITYQLEYHFSLKEVKKRVNKLPKDAVPFLLFFIKPEN